MSNAPIFPGAFVHSEFLPFRLVWSETEPMSSADPSAASALDDLERLLQEGLNAFESAIDADSLEKSRVSFLGLKQGRIKTAQEVLKTLPGPDRKAYGQRFNAVKSSLESSCEQARERIESGRTKKSRAPIDLTVPGSAHSIGRRHPLTQTAEELIDIFGRMGFSLARGPEIEDTFHNFVALNIPDNHPAREPLDNFYVTPGTLLRSQTSTVQIRVMEKSEPPIRVVALGRVYRPDAVDATHSFMFHQIEGLYVDRNVTMANLKSTLRQFASSYLGQDVTVRFRPSFFPFTEPSVEVDMQWDSSGRWVEMGGAGMVDPNVLKAVGYDPEIYSGFAFGLGIERLCMRRHGIDDIRPFYQNEIRFLKQF
jgi:phenylalanyl-tRNA synthetase alpha chain